MARAARVPVPRHLGAPAMTFRKGHMAFAFLIMERTPVMPTLPD
jgi:hypothetical protein